MMNISIHFRFIGELVSPLCRRHLSTRSIPSRPLVTSQSHPPLPSQADHILQPERAQLLLQTQVLLARAVVVLTRAVVAARRPIKVLLPEE